MGIPFSHFAGRVVSTGEPVWLPEDRDIALVWQMFDRTRCSRCSTWDWEWQENPLAWVADLWRCAGCEQIDKEHEVLRESKGQTHGLQVRLFRE